jgi:isoleucyl-tRNA synthetase
VPIPVFYDRATGKDFLLNDDTLSHIQSIFAEYGSDAWWKMDVVDLLPDQYKSQADEWVKGSDTMDVWFDSGKLENYSTMQTFHYCLSNVRFMLALV